MVLQFLVCFVILGSRTTGYICFNLLIMLKDIELNWMKKYGRTKCFRVMHILCNIYFFLIEMKKSEKMWINITKKFELLY